MSTLLFFLPRDQSTPVQSGQELIDAGITYVDALEGQTSNFTVNGPAGLGGAIASLHYPDGKQTEGPLYRKDEQVWRRHPSGKYWVGYEKKNPPTPETLARRKMIDGVEVKLIGGGTWIVPICVPNLFGTGAGSTLPRQYDLDDSGNVTSAVRVDFESLAERCYGFFQRFIGQVKHPETTAEQVALFQSDLNLACDLLAVNYRISKFEAVGLLKLLGSDEYGRVLRASIEADAIERAAADAAKKAPAPDASAISSGESGSPLAAGASNDTGSAMSS